VSDWHQNLITSTPSSILILPGMLITQTRPGDTTARAFAVRNEAWDRYGDRSETTRVTHILERVRNLWPNYPPSLPLARRWRVLGIYLPRLMSIPGFAVPEASNDGHEVTVDVGWTNQRSSPLAALARLCRHSPPDPLTSHHRTSPRLSHLLIQQFDSSSLCRINTPAQAPSKIMTTLINIVRPCERQHPLPG
jgi:hypothetical protein